MKKKVILLLGGVGAGKSQILDILSQEFQAEIIQADQVAKELEEKGNLGYCRLVERFGETILAEDGAIDKRRFADLIFADKEALAQVNQMIHPLVWQTIADWSAKLPSGIGVIESAIPNEKRGDFYDEVWYVYTQKEVRIQRLMENRGYSYEKCCSILENQPQEETYQELADHVIDNSSTLEETRAQIRILLERAY